MGQAFDQIGTVFVYCKEELKYNKNAAVKFANDTIKVCEGLVKNNLIDKANILLKDGGKLDTFIQGMSNHVVDERKVKESYFYLKFLVSQKKYIDVQTFSIDIPIYVNNQEEALDYLYKIVRLSGSLDDALEQDIQYIIARTEYICVRDQLLDWAKNVDKNNISMSGPLLNVAKHLVLGLERKHPLSIPTSMSTTQKQIRQQIHAQAQLEAVDLRGQMLIMFNVDLETVTINPAITWQERRTAYLQYTAGFLDRLDTNTIQKKQEDYIKTMRDEIFKRMIADACALLGPAPCDFAIVQAGSWANGLGGMQSDAEFFFILADDNEAERWRISLQGLEESEKLKSKFLDKKPHYFQRLVYLLQVNIKSLGSASLALDKGYLFGDISKLISYLDINKILSGKQGEAEGHIHTLLHGNLLHGDEDVWKQYNEKLGLYLTDKREDIANFVIQKHHDQDTPKLWRAYRSEYFDLKLQGTASLYYWVTDTDFYALPTTQYDFRQSLIDLHTNGIIPKAIFDKILISMNMLQLIRNGAVNPTEEEMKKILYQLNQYLLLPLYTLYKTGSERKINSILDFIKTAQMHLDSLEPTLPLSNEAKCMIRMLAYWTNQTLDQYKDEDLNLNTYQSLPIKLNNHSTSGVDITSYNRALRYEYIYALETIANEQGTTPFMQTARNDLLSVSVRLKKFPMYDGWSCALEETNNSFINRFDTFFETSGFTALPSNLLPLTLSIAESKESRGKKAMEFKCSFDRTITKK